MIAIQLNKALLSATGEMKLSVDLHIKPGEFVALSGPSGSGKTTLLRLIAGLAQPDSGLIRFDGQLWLDTSNKLSLPPQKRNVGLVFQDYALFPNMTVRNNLQYGLKPGQPDRIVTEIIAIMELEELVDRYPNTLSGGQQQRVALARALVRKPAILLLDEPLSALDPAMRTKLQDYVLKVHQAFQLTTILVSHDTTEIIKMADRMIVLENGAVIKTGEPEAIFFSDATISPLRLSGRIVDIHHTDAATVVRVSVGSDIVQVIASHSDIEGLQSGDKVMLVSTTATFRLLAR